MVRYTKRQIIISLIIFASANIKVVYNIAPTVTSYEKILDVFWHTHIQLPSIDKAMMLAHSIDLQSFIMIKKRSLRSQKEILKKHVFTKNLL